MPAIVLCGRRWLAASDDFVFQGFIVAACHAALAITGYVLLYDGQLNDNSRDAAHCPGSSNALSHSTLAMLVINIVSVIGFFLLAVTSVRGRILEPSKRTAVPKLVYLTWFLTLAALVGNAVALHYAYLNGEIDHCPSNVRAALHFVLIGNLLLWIYLVVSSIMKFDPHGSRSHDSLRDSEDDYLTLWRQRCGCATACCCIFGGGGERADLLDDVALTMAKLFDAHDVVMSDITAGLVLLHQHQKRQHAALREETRRATAADDLLGRQGLRLGGEARVFHPLTAADRNDLAKLHHFSKYFLAAYGYLLFWYQHLFSGLPRLWVSDCAMCCRSHPTAKRRSGDCCYCNLTAIRKVAHVENEDILMTSFENRVLLPAFYVAVDHATTSVVIAVRGSMSLYDCITDVVAQPRVMEVADLDQQEGATPSYVHGGMLRCMENVLQRIREQGVLDMLVDGAYSSHNVVIVGHSLGAGVATLMAVRLRDMYPAMRPRLQAFAYAPPGGLMTKQLSEYTDGFVTGGFMGKDLVPRLAAHTMNELRDSLFLSIAATQHSKARVVGSVCCPTVCMPDPLPDKLEASAEELNYVMSMLRPSVVPGGAAASPNDGGVDADGAPFGGGVNRPPIVLGSSAGTTPREMRAVTPLRPAPGRSFASAAPPPAAGTPPAAAADAAGAAAAGRGEAATDPMLQHTHIKLFPPNRLYHFVKAANRTEPCSMVCGDPGTAGCCKFNEYWPTLTCPEELQEVVVSPLMAADHMPDRFFFVLQHSCASVEEQRLHPLVSSTARRPGPPGCPENAAAGHSQAHARMLYRPNVDVLSRSRAANYGAVDV